MAWLALTKTKPGIYDRIERREAPIGDGRQESIGTGKPELV